MNGAPLLAGARRVVDHGDTIRVPAAQGKTIAFAISFTSSAGLIGQVRFDKSS